MSIFQESGSFSLLVSLFPVATITKSIHSFELYRLFVQKDLWYLFRVDESYFVILETYAREYSWYSWFFNKIMRVYGIFYVVHPTRCVDRE